MYQARLLAVHPVLPSRDVPASLEFYQDRLKFRVTSRDSDSDTRYACLRRDEIEIHIQWHDPAEWSAVERPMLRILVGDVDLLFEEYQPRGVFHDKTALRDTPWGTREFAFYDRDGNGLTFYAG